MRKHEDDGVGSLESGAQHQARSMHEDNGQDGNESVSDDEEEPPTYQSILEKAWRTGKSVELPTNLIMLFQMTMCACTIIKRVLL